MSAVSRRLAVVVTWARPSYRAWACAAGAEAIKQKVLCPIPYDIGVFDVTSPAGLTR